MRAVGLPEIFIFETLDLYEKKNIPKVIYCIHALSHLLAKLGLAPHIKNLVGKLQFTDEQLDATSKALDEAGVPMPQFSGVAGALAKELSPADRKCSFQHSEREQYLNANVHKIILCQSVVRMHLARKKYLANQKYWKDNEKAVIMAQAHWRGLVARRRYNEKINRFKASEHLMVKVQAKWRGILARREYQKRRQFYKDHLQAIIKIQSKWKARHMQKAYNAICISTLTCQRL